MVSVHPQGGRDTVGFYAGISPATSPHLILLHSPFLYSMPAACHEPCSLHAHLKVPPGPLMQHLTSAPHLILRWTPSLTGVLPRATRPAPRRAQQTGVPSSARARHWRLSQNQCAPHGGPPCFHGGPPFFRAGIRTIWHSLCRRHSWSP